MDNGIKVDAHGRTSDPHIWAAGDCASFPYRGNRIRLESVPNAIDQAEVVAENIMGADKEYVAKSPAHGAARRWPMWARGMRVRICAPRRTACAKACFRS